MTPKAVICGSFRRDPEGLRKAFHLLQAAGCHIVSPAAPDFVREIDGFVYGAEDVGQTTIEIERSHLEAMEAADLIWLHCPGGYVGSSAAMELGFARAIGLRIFAVEPPTDRTLADQVRICDSPGAAVKISNAELGTPPAHALPALQSYYARAALRRGGTEDRRPSS